MRNRVLILGATSSVAIELAKILAQRKCELILAARSANRLIPLAQDLRIRYNAEVDLIEFDAEAVHQHKKFYSEIRLKPDVVICLFGVLGNQGEALQDFNKTLGILNANYVGGVSILNEISRDFKARREGIIVGVSSVAGERGRQSNFLYGSAKAGFSEYLSGLRNELYNYNVTVITIKPGFIRSKMITGIQTPKILTASPTQVANAIQRAVQRKKDVVYTLWIWRWIMLVIKLIPESIFKRMKL